MKKTLTYLLVFFCYYAVSHAQNGGVANNWYFGLNAGLNFNTGSPTPISGPIYTEEGCATISDINGNLLFSTDGVTVYNKNNIQMPNGFGLWGHSSSTQSALIIPNPGNANQYYIFTAASQAGFTGVYDGIAYSIVDMSLNGGLGDVTIKNDTLVHPAAEKLTAVKHCNGTDYWVICHQWDSDAFYAYQVSISGISAPIISHIAGFHNGSSSGTHGYLKASPNGKRLASARSVNFVEIFDFDNATGIISNFDTIPFTANISYGITFSPDNAKLYVTPGGGLIQYDLNAVNIGASAVVLGNSNLHTALQIGPDGKIYSSIYNSQYLSVINNPNILGAGCNYVQNGVPLNGGICHSGLPNFSDNLIYQNSLLGIDDTLCGNTAILDAGIWSSYSWSTGDITQTITVNQPGQYWVEVTNNCGSLLRDTINVYPCGVAVASPYQLVFSVYPNPISGKDFYVAIENREGREMPFYVYDVMGKLVFSETLKADKNSLMLPAHLANGVYIAKLIDSKNNRIGNIKLTILE